MRERERDTTVRMCPTIHATADNPERPSPAAGESKERARESIGKVRESGIRCAQQPTARSQDSRRNAPDSEVSPGQASAYSPRGRHTSGERYTGERARHADACARADRARRTANVGACRFCAYMCAAECTRTSRARAHHLNRHMAYTRRVSWSSLALWSINSTPL